MKREREGSSDDVSVRMKKVRLGDNRVNHTAEHRSLLLQEKVEGYYVELTRAFRRLMGPELKGAMLVPAGFTASVLDECQGRVARGISTAAVPLSIGYLKDGQLRRIAACSWNNLMLVGQKYLHDLSVWTVMQCHYAGIRPEMLLEDSLFTAYVDDRLRVPY
mmetsp:Transcript_25121/g.40183  ORF Transcript_25121/g.40183 Transcript_25121/m.40183 type:complete len:162 (-) Transcript_25121:42-527(-)